MRPFDARCSLTADLFEGCRWEQRQRREPGHRPTLTPLLNFVCAWNAAKGHAFIKHGHSDRSARTIATLKQLAESSTPPVEAFSKRQRGEAGDLLTLVRLWSSIPDTQGRRRVLSVARQEAERFEARNAPDPSHPCWATPLLATWSDGHACRSPWDGFQFRTHHAPRRRRPLAQRA